VREALPGVLDLMIDALRLDMGGHRLGQCDIHPHILKGEAALKDVAAIELSQKGRLAGPLDRVDHHVFGEHIRKDDNLLLAVGELRHLW
jgi:hypothetical protein